MSFWGAEVKPGKPFILAPDVSNRKLRITQATLGHGTVTSDQPQRISLQCNMGECSPVFLCALSTPGPILCCLLDHVFHESCDVVFSVLGPISLHLSGHYLSSEHPDEDGDDSKLMGEYIADTESDSRRSSDDYDYEDYFINDSEVEVVPPTPSDGGSFYVGKRKRRISRRSRLKKLCKRKLLVSSESERDVPKFEKEVGDAMEENMNKFSYGPTALEMTINTSGTSVGSANEYAGSNRIVKGKKRKRKVSVDENDNDASATIIGTNNMNKIRTLPSGLIVEDLEMGETDSQIAALGKKVAIRYTGKLRCDRSVFTSNVGDVDEPLKFRLGKGKVIQGMDIGIDGMRVGGKRRLTIPPSMGYGPEGDNKGVPPDSWLVYDIELLKVR